MKKHRRIEINAYHRRVTIVSGAWLASEFTGTPPSKTEEGVSLNDSDICEPVEPDSPEGQMLLVEAVRSLERRLSANSRAAMRAVSDPVPSSFSRNALYLKLQSLVQFLWPTTLRFAGKEK